MTRTMFLSNAPDARDARKSETISRIAMGAALFLLLADAAFAQSSGNGAAAKSGNSGGAISGNVSGVSGGPGGTTLGTAQSVGSPGDSKLGTSAPYKADPTLLKSNKELERALRSICRGC